MDASRWHYFTPYDPDPNAALQRLRQEVFATGQYSTHYELGLESSQRFAEAFRPARKRA